MKPKELIKEDYAKLPMKKLHHKECDRRNNGYLQFFAKMNHRLCDRVYILYCTVL